VPSRRHIDVHLRRARSDGTVHDLCKQVISVCRTRCTMISDHLMRAGTETRAARSVGTDQGSPRMVAWSYAATASASPPPAGWIHPRTNDEAVPCRVTADP
jgi:transposase InsO family protein